MADDPHRISLSAAWEPPIDPARPVWVRHFGRPAGIGTSDPPDAAATGGPRVVLVMEGAPAGLVLNGVALEHESPACQRQESPACQRHESPACQRHDITGLMGMRNELRLLSTVVGGAAGHSARHGRVDLPEAVGRVWLEISIDGTDGSA